MREVLLFKYIWEKISEIGKNHAFFDTLTMIFQKVFMIETCVFFSFEDKKKTLGVRWEQKICIVNAWLSKNWFKKIFLDFCLFLENLRILKYFFLSKNSNGLAILYIRCIFNDFRSNLNAENISLSTVIHNFLLKFDKILNFLMFFFVKPINQFWKKSINDTDFLLSTDP